MRPAVRRERRQRWGVEHVSARPQHSCSMRWGLGVGGVLGLLCAVSTVPIVLYGFTRGAAVVDHYFGLPIWLQGGNLPPSGFGMIILGGLCALLLVSGRWLLAVFGAAAAAWFVYADVTFSPGGHWIKQLEMSFTTTPYRVHALVSLALLLVISLVALLTAARGEWSR